MRLAPVLAVIALLAGCASTTPTPEGMIPALTVRGVRGPVHPDAVAIEVKDTKQIPEAALRQALADAVTMSKVFARVAPRGPYVLSVTVTKLEVPQSRFNINLNPTVRMEAGWTLRRADTRAAVWQATVRSQYTAEPSDTLDGKARLRMATEGAVRENIALGLGRIAKLSLGSSARTRADAEPAAAEATTVSIVPYADPRDADGAGLRESVLDPAR
jgi:hypothetical protein